MKLIIAIFRPEKLEAVQNALDAAEVHLMTVSNVYGCGSQRGYTENFRGGTIPIRLLQKVKMEIAVNENFVERTVKAIEGAAVPSRRGLEMGRYSWCRLMRATAFARVKRVAWRSGREVISKEQRSPGCTSGASSLLQPNENIDSASRRGKSAGSPLPF